MLITADKTAGDESMHAPSDNSALSAIFRSAPVRSRTRPRCRQANSAPRRGGHRKRRPRLDQLAEFVEHQEKQAETQRPPSKNASANRNETGGTRALIRYPAARRGPPPPFQAIAPCTACTSGARTGDQRRPETARGLPACRPLSGSSAAARPGHAGAHCRASPRPCTRRVAGRSGSDRRI